MCGGFYGPWVGAAKDPLVGPRSATSRRSAAGNACGGLDPGEEGPPYPLSVAELTALFAEGYEIVDDYVPNVAFPGREGRERVRVLRRVE